MALPGTDVNPAGRAPARLAVHCCLATGGPGAATRHAPFGRPRHPLGTFPCGKVPRPPAGGRNLPQETDFLWEVGKGFFLLFPVSWRVSPLRRRPKGFPIAPWTPSGPIPIYVGETSHKKQISCGRQGKFPLLHFRFTSAPPYPPPPGNTPGRARRSFPAPRRIWPSQSLSFAPGVPA